MTFQRNLSRAFRAAALSGFLRTDGKTYALKDGSRQLRGGGLS